MIHGRELEVAVLSVLLADGGEADLQRVLTFLENHPSLTLRDWASAEPSGDPAWIQEVRRSFQQLKDAGEVTGYEEGAWTLTPSGYAVIPPGNDWVRTLRTSRLTVGVQRDRGHSLRIKALYDFRCQVCGERIDGGPSGAIVESHHLRPVGEPHSGPDVERNLVVLCPNHHAQFDRGVLAIHPVGLRIESYNGFLPPTPLKALKHTIAREFLDYHWHNIFLRGCSE